MLGLEVAIDFIEGGALRGAALKSPDGTTPIALRHDPQRPVALSGFDLVALGVPTRGGVHAWAVHLDAIDQQLALDRADMVGELVLIEPPLIDPLLPSADRAALAAAIGPDLGATMGAAAQGDPPTAFETFLTAVCGPDYRSVIEVALGRAGLERAERDCGYCFSGEIPSLAAWQLNEACEADRAARPPGEISDLDPRTAVRRGPQGRITRPRPRRRTQAQRPSSAHDYRTDPCSRWSSPARPGTGHRPASPTPSTELRRSATRPERPAR